MSCSFNRINFVGTFYIYLSWLQVLKVGGNFYFTNFFDSENQDFHLYSFKHMPV